MRLTNVEKEREAGQNAAPDSRAKGGDAHRFSLLLIAGGEEKHCAG